MIVKCFMYKIEKKLGHLGRMGRVGHLGHLGQVRTGSGCDWVSLLSYIGCTAITCVRAFAMCLKT